MKRSGLAVAFGLLATSIASAAGRETLTAAFAIDELEYRVGKRDHASWDATFWWGSDRHRLYVSTEGEERVEGRRAGDAELRVRYSRMLSAFWDARAGVRHDWYSGRASGPGRTFAVVGVAGLAPGWIELEPELAIDQDGDFFLRLCADNDLQITQSIVAASSLELNAAFQDSAALRVGAGSHPAIARVAHSLRDHRAAASHDRAVRRRRVPTTAGRDRRRRRPTRRGPRRGIVRRRRRPPLLIPCGGRTHTSYGLRVRGRRQRLRGKRNG